MEFGHLEGEQHVARSSGDNNEQNLFIFTTYKSWDDPPSSLKFPCPTILRGYQPSLSLNNFLKRFFFLEGNVALVGHWPLKIPMTHDSSALTTPRLCGYWGFGNWVSDNATWRTNPRACQVVVYGWSKFSTKNNVTVVTAIIMLTKTTLSYYMSDLGRQR